MLFKVFLGFFRIGLVGYGGGPASLPLVKREFVDNYDMVKEEDLMELVAICNMLPGPIITKVAAVIGYRNGGILGAFLAFLGMLLPSSLFLLLILNFFYESAKSNPDLQMMINAIIPVVAIMMTNLVWGFLIKTKAKFSYLSLIIQIAFYTLILIYFNISAIYVIVAVIALTLLSPVKKKEKE